jgi:hypothetical protein
MRPYFVETVDTTAPDAAGAASPAAELVRKKVSAATTPSAGRIAADHGADTVAARLDGS